MKLTYRWRATLVIALGLLMAVLDATIVSVVLPQSLHAQGLQLHACIEQHALTMGMNDTFLFTLICCIVSAVLAIFPGRDRALEEALAVRQREEHGEVKAPTSIGD